MDVDGCRWMDPKVKGREEGGPSGTIGAIRLLLLQRLCELSPEFRVFLDIWISTLFHDATHTNMKIIIKSSDVYIYPLPKR
jgi:hypothetical protein